MIVEVFLILLAVALILLGLGYSVKEASFSIIGLVFLFVLSTGVLIPDNLEVRDGLTINESMYYVYGNNLTGYHWDYDDADSPVFNPSILNSPEAVFILHEKTNTIQSYNYTNPETTFYGIWLSVLAGAGFYFIWHGVRSKEEDLL